MNRWEGSRRHSNRQGFPHVSTGQSSTTKGEACQLPYIFQQFTTSRNILILVTNEYNSNVSHLGLPTLTAAVTVSARKKADTQSQTYNHTSQKISISESHCYHSQRSNSGPQRKNYRVLAPLNSNKLPTLDRTTYLRLPSVTFIMVTSLT